MMQREEVPVLTPEIPNVVLLTRRELLEIGLGSSLLRAMPVESNAPIHVYIQESGNYGGKQTLSLGMLFARNREKHFRYLKELRSRLHFRTGAAFRSNNKYKIEYLKQAFTYLLRDPDLNFSARIFGKSRRWQQLSKQDREAEYHSSYKRALSQRAGTGENMHLYLRKHFLGDDDRLLHDYLRRELSQIKSIEIVKGVSGRLPPGHSRDRDDLLELANFLTGSIWLDTNTGGGGHTKSTSLANLKGALRVRTLSAPTLSGNPKFNVEVI